MGTAAPAGGPLSGTILDLVDPSLLIAGAGLLVITGVFLARGSLRKAGHARS